MWSKLQLARKNPNRPYALGSRRNSDMESQSSLSTLSSGKKVPGNVTSRSTLGNDSETRVKLLEGSFIEKVDQGKGPISLPIELLGEIGMYLEDSYDRLSFCLTSRTVYAEILPILYSSVEFKGFRICIEGIQWLMSVPRVSNSIREFVLRPSWDSSEREPRRSLMRPLGPSGVDYNMEWDREKSVISLLEDLAWRGSLQKLEKFIWGGRDIPGDSLWKVLRDRCPRLNDIGTNVGPYLFNLQPESELFKFNDLKGFSITTETNIARADTSLRRPDPFPTEMWDMLTRRSPHLERLSLGGHSPMQFSFQSVDIFPIFSAIWPHLQSLSLEIGGPIIDTEFTKYPYDFYSRFRIFLSKHPNITDLRTHGFPEFICPDFLNLKFVATEMSKYTPRIKLHHTLEVLDLGGRPNAGVVAQEIGATLQCLPALRKFRVWMDFSHDTAHLKVYDAVKEYRDMLANTTGLEELSVICSTKGKVSLLLDEFSQVMFPLHRLKRLELCKLHSPSDPTLFEAASQYIAEHPTLEFVSISSMLREEGPHGWPLMKLHKMGTFRTIRDDEGIPKGLVVHEKFEGGFLWGNGRTNYEKDLSSDKKAVARWMVENATQRYPANVQ